MKKGENMTGGLGTLMNIVTVLIGGSVGLILGSRLKKSLNEAVINAMALVVIVIGVQMAFESKNILIVLASLVIGTIIGELINIDSYVSQIGNFMEQKFSKDKDGKFARAFVTASLIFCVGPLTILGSIQDGLTGDYKLLATKSMLDGFTAVMFSSAMGVGGIFSALSIFIIQGGLTLFAGTLIGVMTEAVIAEITGVGGVMVFSIGLGILGIKKLKTVNMLPALIIAPMIVLFISNLGK